MPPAFGSCLCIRIPCTCKRKRSRRAGTHQRASRCRGIPQFGVTPQNATAYGVRRRRRRFGSPPRPGSSVFDPKRCLRPFRTSPHALHMATASCGGRWHVSQDPSLAVPCFPSTEACPGCFSVACSGRRLSLGPLPCVWPCSLACHPRIAPGWWDCGRNPGPLPPWRAWRR